MSKELDETTERIILYTIKEAYDKINEIEKQLSELHDIVGEVCNYVKGCDKLENKDE